MKYFIYGLLLGSLLAALMGCSGEYDANASEYCEMRQIWEQDKENGVIEVRRSGYPSYKGDESCENLAK